MPPPSTPRPKMKMGAVIGVVIVVVAAGILGGLYFSHTAPFQTNGTGGGAGSGETFSQAASQAQPSTSSVSGGPWTLAGGIGVVITSSIAVNSSVLNASFTGGLCQPKFLSTESKLTSIPSTSASATAGTTNAWIVVFSNSTGGALEVAVFGSAATPVLTIVAWGGCALPASSIGLPSTYLDSPAAESVAFSHGGSAFVAAHPSFNVEEILVPTVTLKIGGISTTTASTWEISYTDCNLGADNGGTLGAAAPEQFLASINASSGAYVRGINTTTACASSGGSGGGTNAKNSFTNVTEVFSFEQQHSKSSYWNNGSWLTSLTDLTVGEITVSIENNTTGAVVSTTGMTLQILNISFASLSVYSFSTNTWSNPSTAIGTSGAPYVFSLNSAASLKGDKFVVTATASAPATGSVSAPLGKPA